MRPPTLPSPSCRTDASPGPGSPTIGVTAATASLQKKTQNQQKTHSTQPPQLPDDLTRQPLQASSEPPRALDHGVDPSWRSTSSSTALLSPSPSPSHSLFYPPPPTPSLYLSFSFSPSLFFSVFMTFTHFLFNEKNRIVWWLIFSVKNLGRGGVMAREPLRNGQRKR